MSCDLEPSEIPGPHYQGDVRDILSADWDLMVAHPPCTHLAVSGASWFKLKLVDQIKSLQFIFDLLQAPIPHICLENPVSIFSSIIKPTQIIQPWQFGHGETKTTCLWLHNLPPLNPTDIVSGREPKIHWMPPTANRARERSRTYQGIADAMANQWGSLPVDWRADVGVGTEKQKTVRSSAPDIDSLLNLFKS